MNRRDFLRSLGIGAAVPLAMGKAAVAPDAPDTIAKYPQPWQSKLSAKWYGYNDRESKWVEIPEPK